MNNEKSGSWLSDNFIYDFYFIDCLDRDNFLAGEVLIHSINAHVGRYGDGGCMVGKYGPKIVSLNLNYKVIKLPNLLDFTNRYVLLF